MPDTVIQKNFRKIFRLRKTAFFDISNGIPEFHLEFESKHVRELKIVILNGTSGFKKVLPVEKGYFRFRNFVVNCNPSSKIYLKAQNREFQGHFRSEGSTSGFKIFNISF